MSGLDPLAALAAQAVANAQAAMDAAVLSLGVDVAVLQAQVNVGEVIAATVLPPQGGTDLLSFLGQTVTAQIPPGIDPGETMLLQVTGFTNSAVIVKNLGTLDPQNPIPTVNVEIAPQPPGAPQSAILTTTIPGNVPPTASSSPPATASSPPPATAATPPPVTAPSPPSTPPQLPPQLAPATNTTVAPPREVFVAASVRQNVPVERIEQTAAQAIEAVEDEALGSGSDVEVRIALNRASAPAPPPTPATSRANAAPAASNAAQTPAARATPRSIPVAPPIVRPAATTAAPVQAPRAPQSAEGALLARLRVPVTPITLAAARTVNTATQRVTTAYENLENALAKLAPEESGALRSMLAFVGRFDLRNVRSLPEQIATFVSDVLDGAEAKIVQAVSAWNELEETPALETQTAPAVQEQASAAQSQAPAAQPQAAAAQPPQASPAQQTPSSVAAVAAQAAERTAAMDYDVKSAILSMIAAPPAGDSPALSGALRDALTATTALQLNVLNAQASDTRAITIPLPAYFYDGGGPASLRISRDAPNSKNKMDADNFHITFVLDTKSLGTVAIDVQTVGRAVSVDVKTQATLAADRFRSTLDDLRSRLEQMRYRVATIGAGVAPPSAAQIQKSEPPAPAERKSFWDMRA
jgi:Flagellar hook-length control protein FliK